MTMKREKGRNGGDKNRFVGDGASLRTGMRNWKGRNGEGRSIKVKVKGVVSPARVGVILSSKWEGCDW